jgi:hypothetical protein
MSFEPLYVVPNYVMHIANPNNKIKLGRNELRSMKRVMISNLQTNEKILGESWELIHKISKVIQFYERFKLILKHNNDFKVSFVGPLIFNIIVLLKLFLLGRLLCLSIVEE